VDILAKKIVVEKVWFLLGFWVLDVVIWWCRCGGLRGKGGQEDVSYLKTSVYFVSSGTSVGLSKWSL
jgi:hypothetical protein